MRKWRMMISAGCQCCCCCLWTTSLWLKLSDIGAIYRSGSKLSRSPGSATTWGRAVGLARGWRNQRAKCQQTHVRFEARNTHNIFAAHSVRSHSRIPAVTNICCMAVEGYDWHLGSLFDSHEPSHLQGFHQLQNRVFAKKIMTNDTCRLVIMYLLCQTEF